MLSEYPLSVPPGAGWFLVIILLPLLFLSPVIWADLKRKPKAARAVMSVFLIGIVLLMVFLIIVSPVMTKAVIDDGELTVRTPPYATIRLEREEIRAAYVADWRETTELMPVVRTGGTAMGTYKTGHFRLENGADAVLMTATSRVLVLDVGSRFILVAPDNFDAFVQEFGERVMIPDPVPPADIAASTDVKPMRGLPVGTRLVFVFIGLALLGVGYLIRFKKMLWLLSGYDESRVKDKEAMARFGGNFAASIGLALILMQFLDIKVFIFFIIAIIPVGIFAVYKMNTL